MLALRARVGASTLDIDFAEIRGWAPLLDSATAIYLHHDGREVVTVQLDGFRRWVAFRREMAGSLLYCVGYQETVGAAQHGNLIIGGSNRKTLAWVYPCGRVSIGDKP